LTNVSTGFKYIYGHNSAYIEPYLQRAPVEVVNSLDRRGDLIHVNPDISNRNFKFKIKLRDEIVDLWVTNLKNDPDLCAKVEKGIKEKHRRLVVQITIKS
jgi:hypothetical protein